MSKFNEWFEIFIEEKDLPYASWEIEGADGELHIIDTEFIVETIKNCPPVEQRGIKDMLVRIDFMNADVNDYFHHLAKGLVANF